MAMTQPKLITNPTAGMVAHSQDGRKAIIPITEGLEWRLAKFRRVECFRCPKVYLGMQDYTLHVPGEKFTGIVEETVQRLCNTCSEKLMD